MIFFIWFLVYFKKSVFGMWYIKWSYTLKFIYGYEFWTKMRNFKFGK